MTKQEQPVKSRLSPFLALLALIPLPAAADVLTGTAAFGDWGADRPGVERWIRPQDLPLPMATQSVAVTANVVKRPTGGKPRVPPGFDVTLAAEGLAGPRTLRTAPNGDIFVAETRGGKVSVLVFGADGKATHEAFASGLNRPYGLAFYPPGPNPNYLYVAETNRVIRFPYRAGDRVASGEPEVIVSGLPTGGHSTRDIAFSPDGKQLFIAVGSLSNAGDGVSGEPPGGIAAFERKFGVGAAWGKETGRASVLTADPDGKNLRHFANGIRNCSGVSIQPATGALWCATNERDGLGDNLPPDFVTRVEDGAFYGWPWFYTGANVDPRHKGERGDLAGKATTPDVLIQPHSAPLGLAFYEGDSFPAEYRGDAFLALHGSWNRSGPTGYKVVRVRFEDGKPTGAYEDFMTGFVLSQKAVWGRPVGVTVGKDGALYVSEDAGGSIWRVQPLP
ncbi:sorbosone dehydrogenase [Kaistia algarum]|uniref:PQQ-dependent sugar dehydrogenase n=1 Tax=Kaistia algarum TaxID=2083279 RepID=UPI000CE777CF|nr:PQQ-dependent sugar dehydrogenase [Kaistia algarum]MCX5516092.1 PQQ-dependent sugar dehydrogenase [Kaistia algarum]PPE78016.1 sorbosone dehydrogenase [Kaistia algarum]